MQLAKLPVPCWGVDTNTKLTAATATALAAATIPGGGPVKFVARYVSLHSPQPYDITTDEAAAVNAAGLTLLLVQHVLLPGWVATAALGNYHGTAAAYHATSVGYPAGCHLVMDLEGVRNSGTNVLACCEAWAAAVRKAGYMPALYIGYASGLSQAQLAIAGFDVFWSDFGPRLPPVGVGFAMKQHAQVTLTGVGVDPDYATADLLGNCFIGAVADTNVTTVDPV